LNHQHFHIILLREIIKVLSNSYAENIKKNHS
jgi:hypothetical protein